jgi:putative membrane protein
MKKTEKTALPRRKRSLLKGFAAGAIGGLCGAAAKAAGEAVYPPRTIGQIPPPAVLVNRMAGRSLTETEEEVSVRVIHWGFGALVGGVYGALAEYQPAVTKRFGASFGLTLYGITHASALPLMGLTEKPEDQPLREHASELVTHAIYGVTTEVVRRVARKVRSPADGTQGKE